MMKRGWLLIPMLLVVGGEYVSADENEKIARNHSMLNEQVAYKIPVHWEVTLGDDWNGKAYYVVMNDFGYLTDEQLHEEELRQFASELASQIDTPMQNAKIDENGELIYGKERVILAESDLVEQLLSLPIGEKEVQLPIEVTEPNVSKEDVIGIDKKVIGEFTTYFNQGVAGRSENIVLSSNAISNVVLGPGDSFSFNQTVGERTVERGYQEAMEIVNKEFVMGIGGGICQTSSTLFNAVDAAGLEMVERYSHSRDIGYVQEGRDATVSWGGPDFRFTNPHSYPVLIKSHVNIDRGEITVTVHTHK
ncbi:vancomycin resistance protein YoaR [Halalkalibacter nanhaiisediminis]|uniref:Vancomycin resistance protein YoaR n=2 Tax=Halalkalibacter nanhaiisediminis TaxID=688079 RepID=A0A562QD42_9BACI|nr:vancomycin resistance protein YoaR [Halalkalibacter nanhaiisediminis]